MESPQTGLTYRCDLVGPNSAPNRPQISSKSAPNRARIGPKSTPRNPQEPLGTPRNPPGRGGGCYLDSPSLKVPSGSSDVRFWVFLCSPTPNRNPPNRPIGQTCCWGFHKGWGSFICSYRLPPMHSSCFATPPSIREERCAVLFHFGFVRLSGCLLFLCVAWASATIPSQSPSHY